MGQLDRLLESLPHPVELGGVPRIKCARRGCQRTVARGIRAADSLPAPMEAGWYEVQLPDTQTVVFACSKRCAQAVATADVQLLADARPTSDTPLLPQ